MTPSLALFTMLYCMTEMVIFALCDSSHFEADIWLVLSPQCMMLSETLLFCFVFWAFIWQILTLFIVSLFTCLFQ